MIHVVIMIRTRLLLMVDVGLHHTQNRGIAITRHLSVDEICPPDSQAYQA